MATSLSHDTETATQHDVIRIDGDEHEAARRDPRVRALWAEADELLEQLERDGRNL